MLPRDRADLLLLHVGHLLSTLEAGYDISVTHDLQRFLDRQDRDGDYDRALREVRAGRKETHWMWFVFPQLTGLGRSGNATLYGISGLDEARAYLAHPVLGPRLREVATALTSLDATDPLKVLNSRIDVLKLRSSMTLFAEADPDEPVFRRVLEQYYDGEPDKNTLRLLR